MKCKMRRKKSRKKKAETKVSVRQEACRCIRHLYLLTYCQLFLLIRLPFTFFICGLISCFHYVTSLQRTGENDSKLNACTGCPHQMSICYNLSINYDNQNTQVSAVSYNVNSAKPANIIWFQLIKCFQQRLSAFGAESYSAKL